MKRNEDGFAVIIALVLIASLFILLTMLLNANFALYKQNKIAAEELQVKAGLLRENLLTEGKK